MTNVCFTFSKQGNHTVLADNFFTSLPLTEYLKWDGIWYTGTTRLKNCPLLAEEDIKKKGTCSLEYLTEENRKIVVVKWFDYRDVTLASSYVGIEPIDSAKHYDRLIRQHVYISRHNIVRLYNGRYWHQTWFSRFISQLYDQEDNIFTLENSEQI